MPQDSLLENFRSSRPTLIAELHPQHQGRMDLLMEMMVSARDVGIDVCKIQVYDSLRTLGSDRWQYLEYDDQQLEELFGFADSIGMPLFASIFDLEDLQRVQRFGMPAYKIASRSVENRALCEAILESGAPVVCSLGGWSETGLPFGDNDSADIFYLDCVSEYPTPRNRMSYAFGDFGSGIDGVSDHSIGPAGAIAAISHGARIVERHMTMTPYRYVDTEKAHLCSSDPAEFRLIRTLGDAIALARSKSVGRQSGDAERHR